MSSFIAKIIASLRQVAPYLAIELILPGGSLIALTLWVLRNRQRLLFALRSGRRRARDAHTLPLAADGSLGA